MSFSRGSASVFASLIIILMYGCATTGVGGVTKDGLLRLNVELMEFVAIHPDVNFAGYTEVFIEPVELEFRSGWRPQSTGSHLSVSPVRLEQLQEKLETMFMAEFTAGLLENPRLQLVDKPRAGALRITPRLKNVTVTNLDGKSNPGQTFSRKQGEASLEMTAHDIESGALVVRLEDARVIANSADGFAVTGAGATDEGFTRIFSGWGAFTGTGILNIAVTGQQSR